MIEFLHKNWIEIFAVVTGLLYVYLQIKQNKIMWIVGFISSAMFVYVFFRSQIYAQSVIYVYYVLISVYGFWRWNNVEAEHALPLPMRQKNIFVLIAISLILSVIIGYILSNFTDSPIPYFDGLVAGFSIVATWMVTQKIIQHWYFWMAINLFCVPLYISQGLYFTAFMFLVYFVMSIIGLQQWKKMQLKQP